MWEFIVNVIMHTLEGISHLHYCFTCCVSPEDQGWAAAVHGAGAQLGEGGGLLQQNNIFFRVAKSVIENEH